MPQESPVMTTSDHASPGQNELSRRLSASVEQLLNLVSAGAISDALSATTGFGSLARLLDRLLQEHPEVALLDQDLSSELKLLQARRDLLKKAGGVWDTSEAADLLEVTPEAVRKRIQRNALLSYKSPSGEHQLPRAQFTRDGVIEGLDEVLSAMHVEDAWMRIQLFLDEDVLGALREGRIEDAVRAVDSYLPGDEHE